MTTPLLTAWWLWSPVPAWAPGPGEWPGRGSDVWAAGGLWLVCGTPRHLRGQFLGVCGSSSPGLASRRWCRPSGQCARASGSFRRRPARPPLCPAADTGTRTVGRKRAPSRDGEFFGLGIKGVVPPRKPPRVTISLVIVTHSRFSEAFSPGRGAGWGSWVLGNSGSHSGAARGQRVTGRKSELGAWGAVSCRVSPGPCRLPVGPRAPSFLLSPPDAGAPCRPPPLGAVPPLPSAPAFGSRSDADSRGRAGPGDGEPALSPSLQRPVILNVLSKYFHASLMCSR